MLCCCRDPPLTVRRADDLLAGSFTLAFNASTRSKYCRSLPSGTLRGQHRSGGSAKNAIGTAGIRSRYPSFALSLLSLSPLKANDEDEEKKGLYRPMREHHVLDRAGLATESRRPRHNATAVVGGGRGRGLSEHVRV